MARVPPLLALALLATRVLHGQGLPGCQFIQDPLDYDSRARHASFDTGDDMREDDLRQAAVVLATVVYQVAMRDGLVPRPAP